MSDGRAAFDLFDADGDGFIIGKEVGLALAAVGCSPTQKEVEAMLHQQGGHEAKIGWPQFQAMMAQAPRPDRTAEQHLLEAFRVFDKNEDGLIPENDLRVIFTTLGEAIETQDMNQLLTQVQVDQNGKVKYADFVKVILKP